MCNLWIGQMPMDPYRLTAHLSIGFVGFFLSHFLCSFKHRIISCYVVYSSDFSESNGICLVKVFVFRWNGNWNCCCCFCFCFCCMPWLFSVSFSIRFIFIDGHVLEWGAVPYKNHTCEYIISCRRRWRYGTRFISYRSFIFHPLNHFLFENKIKNHVILHINNKQIQWWMHLLC